MSDRSEELFRQAKEFVAGGVSRNTLLREPSPLYASRGRGCRLVDVDGVERIDFTNNMASLIHGHAHPAIVAEVTAQLRRGTAFTMATEVEIEFARHLCGRSSAFDKIRFMNSGTEAVMAALKASRAYTGRSQFAKVEGAYHGAYDYAEISQASTPHSWGDRDRPASVPVTMGTPTSILKDVVVLPFNNPEVAVATLDEHRDEIACVLLDLMPHRAGLVPADESFVQALRDWTTFNGALLVFDEVITFRTEVGGMQQRYPVKSDLTALGKVIGGGFPAGAVAGKNEPMSVFWPSAEGVRLPQSGTFSANPITMTAGSTAMKLYDVGEVVRLNQLGRVARERVVEAIAAAGVPATVTGAGSLFRIHLKAKAPTDYRSSFNSPEQQAALNRFIDSMYDNGIAMAHTGTFVLSTPMTEVEVTRLAEAVLVSLRKVKDLLAEA